MVLGLRTKSRKEKERSVDVEFQICVVEIKPWQGLKSVAPATSLILQWKRGSKHSGNTKSVVPQVAPGSDVGKIVFNESFRLPTTLSRESSRKSSSNFEEKCITFDLYDGHAPKGQPLGRASLNLAPYGEIEGYETISIPLAVSKKVLTKGGIPNLLLRVGPSRENEVSTPIASHEVSTPIASRISTSSFPSTHSQSSKTSEDFPSNVLHEHSQESLVAALLSEEDEEIASFTDDEISLGSPPPPQPSLEQNAVAMVIPVPSSDFLARSHNFPMQQNAPSITSAVTNAVPQASPVKAAATAAAVAYAPKRSFISRDRGSSRASSSDVFSDHESPGTEESCSVSSYGVISQLVASKTPESSYSMRNIQPANVHEVPEVGDQRKGTYVKGVTPEVQEQGNEKNIKTFLRDTKVHLPVSKVGEQRDGIDAKTFLPETEICFTKLSEGDSAKPGILKQSNIPDVRKFVHDDDQDQRKHNSVKEYPLADYKYSSHNLMEDPILIVGQETDLSREAFSQLYEASQDEKINSDKVVDLTNKYSNAAEETNLIKTERVSVMNSKLDSSDIRESEVPVVLKELSYEEETGLIFANSSGRRHEKSEGKDLEQGKMKIAEAKAKMEVAEAEAKRLGKEVEMLKGELLDVAATEAALYSIVAEHGSSFQKVHSPARRFARLYLYACQHGNQDRRASSAKNFASGLAVAARACGHDVPRLTYWWSNAVVLRETLSSTFNVFPISRSESIGSMLNSEGMTATRKAEARSKLDRRTSQNHMQSDWREPLTFIDILERLEAWIFAKVVESVWWQALMPHIQRSRESGCQENNIATVFGEDEGDNLQNIDNNISTSELGDGRRAHISIDLWKKAFSNAFQRLCPVRAAGVECGCLPMLAKLILEECVARLDVAMFNAILRESEDDVLTDPVSDPITDLQVLPIPVGSLSFGAGAQLKNVIYTLSTWLTTLVSNEGIGSAIEHSTEDAENSLISFPLLKATGDLLMLPKDILLDKSTRKEVLPALNLSLIKKILSIFVPDEFSPEPLSLSLLAAIDEELSIEKQMHDDMEDWSMSSQGMVAAPAIIYTIPPTAFVREWIDDQNSSSTRLAKMSSILRTGHTSDDELDDLESPFSWLLVNSAGAMGGNPGNINVISDQTGSCTDDTTKYLYTDTVEKVKINQRFELLREIWTVE